MLRGWLPRPGPAVPPADPSSLSTPVSTPVPDPLSALLLGMLERRTGFLPVSGSGHLRLAQHWLGTRSGSFNIVGRQRSPATS